MTRTSRHVRFTPKADMCTATRNVRFVPIADKGVHSITSSERACSVAGIFIFKFLCGLKIDHKFERRWLHDGKVGGLVTLKNSARVDPRLSVCIGEIWPIASHTTGGDKFTEWIDGWHPKNLSPVLQSAHAGS